MNSTDLSQCPKLTYVNLWLLFVNPSHSWLFPCLKRARDSLHSSNSPPGKRCKIKINKPMSHLYSSPEKTHMLLTPSLLGHFCSLGTSKRCMVVSTVGTRILKKGTSKSSAARAEIDPNPKLLQKKSASTSKVKAGTIWETSMKLPWQSDLFSLLQKHSATALNIWNFRKDAFLI